MTFTDSCEESVFSVHFLSWKFAGYLFADLRLVSYLYIKWYRHILTEYS